MQTGLRGPFASPQVAANAAGSTRALIGIGAAVGTAGISVAGKSLVGWAEGDGPGPCAIALGATSGQSDTQAANPAKNATPESAGRMDSLGIGKLFGR